MIRSLTVVRQTTPAKFERLSVLLRALGFEDGSGWSDEYSRGAPFLAPIGSLELVDGVAPAQPEILVEVSDLDTAYQVAKKHLEGSGTEIGEIADTHWKSRVFSIELDPDLRIGFWAFNDPAKSQPTAIEGDLNAVGMRFGIVVSRWNAF